MACFIYFPVIKLLGREFRLIFICLYLTSFLALYIYNNIKFYTFDYNEVLIPIDILSYLSQGLVLKSMKKYLIRKILRNLKSFFGPFIVTD